MGKSFFGAKASPSTDPAQPSNLLNKLNMIRTDNTNVLVKKNLKEYKVWLKENNIKYSLVYSPQWETMFPYAINMRNEDALMFKLRFGL